MVNKIDKICIGQARLQVCLPGCNNLTQSKTLPAKVNSVIIGSAFYNYNLHLITLSVWVGYLCNAADIVRVFLWSIMKYNITNHKPQANHVCKS